MSISNINADENAWVVLDHSMENEMDLPVSNLSIRDLRVMDALEF